MARKRKSPPPPPNAFRSARDAYNAGVAAGEAGDFPSAEVLFRTAAEMQPDYLEAVFNWGALLLETRRPAEAVVVFEKAIALDPEFPLAHFMLGTAHGILGDPRRSFFATVQGLRFAPADAGAQANAGRAAFHLHAYTDAAARYMLAARADESNEGYPLNLGAAVMHLTGVGGGELISPGGAFDLQHAASLARLAFGLWSLGFDSKAQVSAVTALDGTLGAKITQAFATQDSLRQKLNMVAARISAEQTYATEELT